MSPQKVVKSRLNNNNFKCPLLSHSLVRIHFFKIVNVWRLEYVKGREYIIMFKKTQHLQFPEDSFARDQILEDVGHLFECYSLSISWICY